MFMDFKQWRSQQQHESENEQQQQQQQQQQEEEQQCAKVPRKLLIDSPQNRQQHEEAVASALPLFVSETYSDHSSSLTTSSTNFSRVEGRNQFSMAQWQELEVQAVIYRHMVAGAAIPPELLYFVKKSLLTSPSPYYLHQYPPQFHSAALMQAGYWGKGAMDAEPGRCRRTDGKKWRCSRDVVAGHKYCERHVHRGRNRSRKPVEFPASGGTAGSVLESLTKPAAVYTGGSVAAAHFGSRSSTFDAFQLHTRSTELRSDRKTLFDARHDSTSMDDKSNNKVLMHFFDDHPKNNGNNLSSTSLSISTPTPENSTSDFLRLSTGNGEELGRRDRSGTGDQEGGRVSWTGAWGGNQVASMGGPLAEAFRSSNNSSPTPGYQCSTTVA